MFITLTQLHDEEAALVNPVISNKDGCLHVALRGLNYEVGYHNIRLEMKIRVYEDDVMSKVYFIRPGFYSIKELIQTIKDAVPDMSIKLAEETNIVTVTVKGANTWIYFDNNLSDILGFDETRITGKYVGDRPARVPPTFKFFYIYLDQLSTGSNLVDGAQSTLLEVLPASHSAGDIISIDYPKPMYKKLQFGDIHQLNLRVLNERGEIVDNNKKLFIAVLEIRDAYYGYSN